MTAEVDPSAPPPEPLFTLDLQDNGGLFAPKSIAEALTWMQCEQQFWAWLRNRSGGGNHDQGMRQALGQLDQALSEVQQASYHLQSNPQQYQSSLSVALSLLKETFGRCLLPHSSTPLAKRIEEFRQTVNEQAASYFAAVYCPPPQGHSFEPKDLVAWRGLAEGLIERFALSSAPGKGRRQASEKSFEQLRVKAEEMLGEKSVVIDALHRDYAALAEAANAASRENELQFTKAQTQRSQDFEQLVVEHKQEMENLRKVFREETALRAPATYWDEKRIEHDRLSKITGAISFVGIAVVAVGLVLLIQGMLGTPQPTATPEAWRLATLVLIGLFAVWGLRLVVRMFLSHLHLATDAAERVVMARTYLSLLEGDKLASKEDRQLILQALFRPTSDGIVKDEGIPPSMLEFLTRQSKG